MNLLDLDTLKTQQKAERFGELKSIFFQFVIILLMIAGPRAAAV